MCYDISYTSKLKELKDYFPEVDLSGQLELFAEQGVHIMGHSYGVHPILHRDMDANLLCGYMEWGCIPFYVKEENKFLRQRASMLNARSERILDDSKSYWYKIKDRRCAIPVNGIYEHREISGWKKKVPYFIQLKAQPMFFLPGLYSVAHLPDKETGEIMPRLSFALITRTANNVMSAIHNSGENQHRMPLFLPLDLSKKWLEADLPVQAYKEIIDYEMPSDQLIYHPVYTIRSPKGRADDKLKNEPWNWDALPPLEIKSPDHQLR